MSNVGMTQFRKAKKTLVKPGITRAQSYYSTTDCIPRIASGAGRAVQVGIYGTLLEP